MTASMTAFARLDESGDWGRATWEIRTVNHRYLDISVRLPEDLRVLENTVREHVSNRLGRGKVDCTLKFEQALSGDEFQVNEKFAEKVIQAADKLEISGPTTINRIDILRWPGVMEKDTQQPETAGPHLVKLLDRTLDIIIESRHREGKKMRAVVEQRCQACLDLVTSVRDKVPDIINSMRERFLQRAGESGIELDSDRLEQEVLILSQKMDVAEEIDRLESHLNEVMRVLDDNNPVGRRLDFLMQEMNREANTLGSKSAHIELSSTSVELKVLIEQMREQIQNIE